MTRSTRSESTRSKRTSPRTTSSSLADPTNPHSTASEQAEEQGGTDASSSRENIASTSSSRSTRSSRTQEATQTRRSGRRASMDPYPSQTEPVPERTRRSTRTREPPARLEIPQVSAALPDQSEQQEVPDVPTQSSDEDAREFLKGKTFELIVLQQPEIGAEAGMRKSTLGRLPIVPAPVVQLIVKNESGQVLDTELPYLFCACSLREENGTSTVDLAPTASGDASQRNREELSALIGNLVRNPHRVQDLEGNNISVFVFEDMSVRMQGKFTLEFNLGEARQAQSPKLAAVVSEPFDVVEWKAYPGRPAEDTVPELSMHLHNQGVPMCIPPLVLSQPAASPPPPSLNPFPVDYPAQDEIRAEDDEAEQPPQGDEDSPADTSS
ncbi:uncharacterized protein JCM6883_001604 [Sporobolomyces salmoneus]|uniref:uncharacterized protein n=1 Tax=Sporobolomyces salmoneus TaxID=183962 RepID=UPI00317471A8